VYFNVNFNVLYKLIKVHFLASELYSSHIKYKPNYEVHTLTTIKVQTLG